MGKRMSPTYLSLQMTAAEKRAEKARQAGEISEMREALDDMTRLASAYYGRRPYGSPAGSVRSPRS
jgi:hypothetical protein